MQEHAHARARLDHDELESIRRCLESRMWRAAGCASMNEYLCRHSNYSAAEARERIKAARALADLPGIRESLRNGKIGWNHARVLARLVTPETESAWRTAAEMHPAMQFREFAAGARPGDHPDDERSADLKPVPVALEMLPDQLAALDEATALMRRREPDLTREHVIAHGCRLVIAEQSGVEAASGRTDPGSAPYLISYSVCPRCGQGARLAGGARVAVRPQTIEKVKCDAFDIGSTDGDGPERGTSTVAPAVRRFVKTRDRGKCRVPGCRAHLYLEVHHLAWRSEGGRNNPANLALLCDLHHDLIHDGYLRVEGDADGELTFRRADGTLLTDRAVVPRDVLLGRRAFVELCRDGFASENVTSVLSDAWADIAGSEDRDDDTRLAMLLRAARRRLRD